MNILKLIFRKKVNYINYKISDIGEQIQALQSTDMDNVRPIGSGDYKSIGYLIKFHNNRLKMLDNLSKMNKKEVSVFYESVLHNLCSDCQQEFNKHTTIGTPCKVDFVQYCMLVLIYEVMNNGR